MSVWDRRKETLYGNGSIETTPLQSGVVMSDVFIYTLHCTKQNKMQKDVVYDRC